MISRLVSAGACPHYWGIAWAGERPWLNSTDSDVVIMSQDDKLIDLNVERAKRVHDLNEKRLNEVRQAFEQAMPLGKVKKKPKNKPKKR